MSLRRRKMSGSEKCADFLILFIAGAAAGRRALEEIYSKAYAIPLVIIERSMGRKDSMNRCYI